MAKRTVNVKRLDYKKRDDLQVRLLQIQTHLKNIERYADAGQLDSAIQSAEGATTLLSGAYWLLLEEAHPALYGART